MCQPLIEWNFRLVFFVVGWVVAYAFWRSLVL